MGRQPNHTEAGRQVVRRRTRCRRAECRRCRAGPHAVRRHRRGGVGSGWRLSAGSEFLKNDGCVSTHERSTPSQTRFCLSVSGALAEPKVQEELQRILNRFFQATGWRPAETEIVAGALKYTKYNFLKRWMMKRIVAKAGGDTDTSRARRSTPTGRTSSSSPIHLARGFGPPLSTNQPDTVDGAEPDVFRAVSSIAPRMKCWQEVARHAHSVNRRGATP